MPVTEAILTCKIFSFKKTSTALVKSCTDTWHSSKSASIQFMKGNEKATKGRLGVPGQYPNSIRVSAFDLHLQKRMFKFRGTPE